MEGTRELPLLPLPFIVVYRVLKDVVEIANVVHGAQRVATQGLEPTGWNCLRLDISEPAKNLLRDHPNLR